MEKFKNKRVDSKKERQYQEMHLSYEKFNKEVGNAPKRKHDSDGISSTMLMSQRLFLDESDDQDLF